MSKIIVDNENEKFINFLKLVNEWSKWIIIFWPRWIWKTFLCKNLINHNYFIDESEFMQHQKTWMVRLRLAEEIGQSYSHLPLEMLSKAPVIIYDDIWTWALTEAYITNTLYWLNKRIEKWLKTIITTNLSEEELLARESRIWSRIFELCDRVHLKWTDRRAKSSEKILFYKN